MQTAHFKVTGMSCGACANTVKGVLLALDGVKDAEVMLDSAETSVQYDEFHVTPTDMISAVRHVGFEICSAATIDMAD